MQHTKSKFMTLSTGSGQEIFFKFVLHYQESIQLKMHTSVGFIICNEIKYREIIRSLKIRNCLILLNVTWSLRSIKLK